MDERHDAAGNAANATVELDCPWCDEPIRTTVAELAGGLACRRCAVRVELVDEPPGGAITPAAALAA